MEKQLIETLTKASASLSLTIWKKLPGIKISWFFEGKTGAYGSKENIFERPCTLSVAQLTGCKTSPAQAVSIGWKLLTGAAPPRD